MAIKPWITFDNAIIWTFVGFFGTIILAVMGYGFDHDVRCFHIAFCSGLLTFPCPLIYPNTINFTPSAAAMLTIGALRLAMVIFYLLGTVGGLYWLDQGSLEPSPSSSSLLLGIYRLLCRVPPH